MDILNIFNDEIISKNIGIPCLFVYHQLDWIYQIGLNSVTENIE